MSTFIVPVDGSDASTESLDLGYQMASSLGATLGIVLVGGLSAANVGQLLDALPASTRNGTHIDTFTLIAPPDVRLAAWLAGMKQPLVVLEAQPRESSEVRDVAQWIAGNAGPSVISLVGRKPPRVLDIRRLLVPLDGSPNAEEILQLAVMIAAHANATLGIVRVVPSRPDHESAPADDLLRIELERDEARAYLDHVARELRKRGVRSTWEVRIGDPGDEIARAAETTASDLILMASHHYHRDPTSGIANAAILGTDIPIIIARITSEIVAPN